MAQDVETFYTSESKKNSEVLCSKCGNPQLVNPKNSNTDWNVYDASGAMTDSMDIGR